MKNINSQQLINEAVNPAVYGNTSMEGLTQDEVRNHLCQQLAENGEGWADFADGAKSISGNSNNTTNTINDIGRVGL